MSKSITISDLISGHNNSIYHREDIVSSDKCGCFYCIKIFSPEEIKKWVDKFGSTAICPYCGIDAIIGDKSKLPITKEFLESMHHHWFPDSSKIIKSKENKMKQQMMDEETARQFLYKVDVEGVDYAVENYAPEDTGDAKFEELADAFLNAKADMDEYVEELRQVYNIETN